MFPRRIHRPQLVAAIALFTLAGLFASAPAYGAPTTQDPKTDDVRRVCAAPEKQGEMTCFALARTDVAGRRGLQLLIDPEGFGPADLRSAYALPSDTAGAGQTIAIVDAFDNPNAEADLAVYRAQYGLPPCTTANGCFKKVNQNGLPSPLPTPNAGWAAEISLDLDMASAVCPNCNLLLVEADSNFNTDLYAAVNMAADLGAKYISLSWGGSESSGQLASEANFNKPGVAITAASGDDGFGVIYPSSSQYVTSVGGTSLATASNSRGWTETVWSGAGSGCSAFTPKPAFQTDSGCSRRTTADVSAVSDPATGVAVYNTFQEDGWVVYGGTSAATPIVAAIYALAGPPATGTYANTYPYETPSGLFDITSGSNGSCGGTYLCTGGPGYDGPTGLGTPNGLLSFAAPGPHGVIGGTVTDAGTGQPIVGARVGTASATSTTDSAGRYTIGLPAGTYDVTANAFGYASKTTTGVTVADDATTTVNFALATVPHVTVSGLVRDGSGHGWPLYAGITVDGVPGGTVYTDPATGRYELDLPGGATYTLRVTPRYPGYQAKVDSVVVGNSDLVHDIALTVEPKSCAAPGYAVRVDGLQETFSSGTMPTGWSVVDHTTGGSWAFTDDGNRGNLTGGEDGFAILDSDFLGLGNSQDSELRTPVLDLSAVTNPSIGFNSDFRAFGSSFGDLDLSIDGGQTWTTLLHNTDSARGPLFVELAIPQAAGQSAVQVRWRYAGTFAWWWEIDNVYVGVRSCAPVHGGLVVGQTIDGNTQLGLDGTEVRNNDAPTASATSAPTPDDPNLGDGFYWLFSPLTGNHAFSATHGGYLTATKTVNVVTNSATRADFTLGAGKIVVTPAEVSKTVKMDNVGTAKVTVKNTGAAPATVSVGERDDGFVILSRQGSGAPLNLVRGSYTPKRLNLAGKPSTGTPPAARPFAEPWTNVADFPTAIMDNAAVLGDGKVYSVGGTDGEDLFASGASYDPSTGAWTPIANMSKAREKPAAAFINGKMYVVGGWGLSGDPEPSLEIYNPVTLNWSAGAAAPAAFAGSGVAVLGGKMYVVGGCDTNVCGHNEVYVYDPAANSWSRVADYPRTTAWLACGALVGQLYCAGGTNATGTTKLGYAYNPSTNAWSPIADLPIDLWAMGYVATSDALLVSGGVTNGTSTLTNQGFAYNPNTDSWSAIANSNNTLYRGGSACGFYKVGGSTGGFNAVAQSEVLPGFDQCGAPADVTWLSVSQTKFTVQPGKSVVLTLTLDASVDVVTQPGDFGAKLIYSTNTPYDVTPTNVTMTVTPPKTWGKITGNVTGAACSGAVPLVGATVQIDTWAAHYTLFTDAQGNYALWLDKRNNPLTVIVAKDTWQPQTKKVRITAGQTTTVNWNLLPVRPC